MTASLDPMGCKFCNRTLHEGSICLFFLLARERVFLPCFSAVRYCRSMKCPVLETYQQSISEMGQYRENGGKRGER